MSDGKEQDKELVRPNEEENPLNDTEIHSETFEEPESERGIISEELVKDRGLVQSNEEETPLIKIDIHSEEPTAKQGIMSEELVKDGSLVRPNKEENPLDDKDLYSKTFDELKIEQGIMSEELVKDRDHVLPNKEGNHFIYTDVHSETIENPEPEQDIEPKASLVLPNNEENSLIDTEIHSETFEEPKSEQGIMPEEFVQDRAPLVRPNIEETPIIDKDTHSETFEKPKQGIMLEELVKDRAHMLPNKEENSSIDTSIQSETVEEPEPKQDIVPKASLVQPNNEENSLIDTEIHSETFEELKSEQGIMTKELVKDRALVRPNKKKNPSVDTNIQSETLEEPEPEQSIMSEELVKDRKQDGIFEKPMCLISSEAGRLEVVEKTVRELERIELPLNVVAIAGLYRTGKSYLMNRLAGQNSGFIMGSSIESTTKGIWVWCRQHPRKEAEVLLLLDTEGLGDATKGNIDHDNKIFTLTTLLSSTLVYNVMSAFNQDAIEKLTYVTMLSKNLKVSSNNPSDDDIESIMPQFVLCVRDFNLKLVHDGDEITEDEYLETCLKIRVAHTQDDEKYNRPRECIKKYFKKRKVFTFDRPASRKIMRCLNGAREEDLNKDFIHETEKFLSYIYTCPGTFLPNKSPVTGSMMATLLREYVAAISAGNVPCVEDAVMIMTRQENKKNTNQAVEEYKSLLKQIQIPVYYKDQLSKSNLKVKEETLSRLQSNLLFDKDNKILKATEVELQVLYEKLVKRNSDLLYDKFTRKLDEIHDKDVKANIRREKYANPGGHAAYEEDIRLLYDKFAEEFKSIDIAEKVRAQDDFESKLLQENKRILQEDKVLSEKVTKDVTIKKLDEMKKDMIQSQQLETRKLEAKLDDQRTYYKEKIKKEREKEREREQIRNDKIRGMRSAYERDQERIANLKALEFQRMMSSSASSKEQEKWCNIS